MFERFAAAARESVAQAEIEASALRSDHIGAEHLLLAIARPESPVAQSLRDHGVDAVTLSAKISRASREPETSMSAEDADPLRTVGIDLDSVRESLERRFGEG